MSKPQRAGGIVAAACRSGIGRVCDRWRAGVSGRGVWSAAAVVSSLGAPCRGLPVGWALAAGVGAYAVTVPRGAAPQWTQLYASAG
jgi:hypothetical protein